MKKMPFFSPFLLYIHEAIINPRLPTSGISLTGKSSYLCLVKGHILLICFLICYEPIPNPNWHIFIFFGLPEL